MDPAGIDPEKKQWLETRKQECIDHIERTRVRHRREREKLELQLETEGTQGAFSTVLCNLMHREEVAGSQGRHQLCERIAEKVDSVFTEESKRYFRAEAEKSQRAWAELFRRQLADQNRLAEDVNSQLAEICKTLRITQPSKDVLSEGNTKENGYVMNGASLPDSLPSLTAENFAAEERRVRREANANLVDNERFHLETAFTMQTKRTATEFSMLEMQKRNHFEAHRSAIEGRVASEQNNACVSSAAGGGSSTTGPRYKSKEKQSRFIHTVPVLLPDVGGGGTGTSSGPTHRDNGEGPSQDREQVEMELRALEQNFEAEMAQLRYQKDKSLRWMRRQSLRMAIRLDYMETDKKHLMKHTSREEVQMMSLIRRSHSCARWIMSNGPKIGL